MDRTKTLGGSDIPAVAGVDKYRTQLDVFLEKKGLAEPRVETWPMRLGTEQEALVANWYGRETNQEIIEHPKIIHPQFIWLSGSPDRVIPSFDHTKIIRGLECKFRSERMREQYGEPGTDEVLESDIAQCCWYLLLFPMAEAWDVAVQFGNQERLIYTVPRDAELIEMFFNIGRGFWENHIIPNIPPALDGSKSAAEYLKKKYPSDHGPMLEPTDEEILSVVRQYYEARQYLQEFAEPKVATLENLLKDFVGTAAGMKGEWGKITWRKSKDGQKVDWEGAFNELALQYDPEAIRQCLTHHTQIKPGSRRWMPKFKGE